MRNRRMVQWLFGLGLGLALFAGTAGTTHAAYPCDDRPTRCQCGW